MRLQLPMSNSIIRITMERGMVRACVHVHIPEIGARARITIRVRARTDTGPADGREEAYERVRVMLGPA